jgi:hypothetical protein
MASLPALQHAVQLLTLLVGLTTLSSQMAVALAEAGTEVGQCDFENEPLNVGHFWDPTCKMGDLGCNGDGRHVECRLCGAAEFASVPCPSSSCRFANEPFIPYFWDVECEAGKLGCWADGIHPQCRFCGDFPYTSTSCPKGLAAPPRAATCSFENEPETPYYWDPSCKMGMHGCNADGVHVHCRFCGSGIYSDIHCAASQVCEFALPPTVPYYWEPECRVGMLGCKADGVHPECRFCATRPFEDVGCPEHLKPPEGVCAWPLRAEPSTPSYWEPTCRKGVLGCWADGIHAECRFCGAGVYSEVVCPDVKNTTNAMGAVAAGARSAGFLGHV